MREGEDAIKDQLKAQGMSDAFIAKVFASEASSAPSGQAPKAPGRPLADPVKRPLRTKVGGGGGMSQADIAASVQGARAAIKANPAAKAAILKHATDSGVPAQALAGL